MEMFEVLKELMADELREGNERSYELEEVCEKVLGEIQGEANGLKVLVDVHRGMFWILIPHIRRLSKRKHMQKFPRSR